MTDATAHTHALVVPGTPPDLSVETWSRPRLLAPVRTLAAVYAQRIGFSEVDCGQVSLATDEALCNVIKHGYGGDETKRIWVKFWELPDHGGIRIDIEDEARQVDPATIRSRDLDDIRPGGLGVHIIHEIMDEVRYARRATTGMQLVMIKVLRSATTAANLRVAPDGDSNTATGTPATDAGRK